MSAPADDPQQPRKRVVHRFTGRSVLFLLLGGAILGRHAYDDKGIDPLVVAALTALVGLMWAIAALGVHTFHSHFEDGKPISNNQASTGPGIYIVAALLAYVFIAEDSQAFGAFGLGLGLGELIAAAITLRWEKRHHEQVYETTDDASLIRLPQP